MSKIWKLPEILLAGLLLGWISWRTSLYWGRSWKNFSGENSKIIVYAVCVAQLFSWIWGFLRKWNLWVTEVIPFLATPYGLLWIVPSIIPMTSQRLHYATAAIPAPSWSWIILFRKHRILGLFLGLLMITISFSLSSRSQN